MARSRIRYKPNVNNNHLVSDAVVIGIKGYRVLIGKDNALWINDIDSGTTHYQIGPQRNLNLAKKIAKTKLIEMGATFAEEFRNRKIEKIDKVSKI